MDKESFENELLQQYLKENPAGGIPFRPIHYSLATKQIVSLLQGMRLNISFTTLDSKQEPLNLCMTIDHDDPVKTIPKALFHELYRACRTSFEFQDLADKLSAYF